MKREDKNNAIYFSHDTDMRNDIKVKALRKKYSHKGYAVWCFILEMLTDCDNYEICFNEKNQLLISADFEITAEELVEIVDYCVYIDLLQKNGDILYSKVLKKRFEALTEYREKKRQAGIKGMQNRWGKKEENVENNITENNTVITSDNIEENSIVKNSIVKNRIEKVYPYNEIVQLWNSICISLPKVNKLNNDRRKKIKLRLNEFGEDYAWLPTAEALFERIQQSSFLKGDNGKWKASFDWVFTNGTNWVKVMEGNYDNCKDQHNSLFQEQTQTKLGAGEYIDNSGRRTYGGGTMIVPLIAPPRPSEKCIWSAETNKWILI